METRNFEGFIAKIVRIGKTYKITIPIQHIKFSGLKNGDLLKIIYKKEVTKNGTNIHEKNKNIT